MSKYEKGAEKEMQIKELALAIYKYQPSLSEAEAIVDLVDVDDDISEIPNDQRYQMCYRIAQKYLMGKKEKRKIRFHKTDEFPDWSIGLIPIDQVGSFIFYKGGNDD